MYIRYYLKDIKLLENEVDVIEFKDEILEKINNIAKQVGAPGYIKTPTFKRKSFFFILRCIMNKQYT